MDENQLISSVLAGNKEAFRFLYRLHKDAAWRLALCICKDEQLAKDALQIAFTSVYKYLHAFRGDSGFKTWVLRIVKNESVRLSKAELRFAGIEEVGESHWQDESAGVQTQLERKEKGALITEVLSRMKEKEAVVLKLFYLEELRIKEISQVLELAESNTKVILHRARKSFKTMAKKNELDY